MAGYFLAFLAVCVCTTVLMQFLFQLTINIPSFHAKKKNPNNNSNSQFFLFRSEIFEVIYQHIDESVEGFASSSCFYQFFVFFLRVVFAVGHNGVKRRNFFDQIGVVWSCFNLKKKNKT